MIVKSATLVISRIFLMLLTKEVKTRISKKIKEIKDINEWSHFDVEVSVEQLNIWTLNYDQVKKERTMWENIAKLSINLLNDFEFFSKFEFKSQFTAPLYKDLLKSIGYIYNGGKWKCVKKPKSSLVMTNIFIYCLYQNAYDKMDKVSYSPGYTSSLNCFFCGYKMKEGDSKCNDCNVSIEESILQHNIENSRNESYSSIKEDTKNCIDTTEVSPKNDDTEGYSREEIKVDTEDSRMNTKGDMPGIVDFPDINNQLCEGQNNPAPSDTVLYDDEFVVKCSETLLDDKESSNEEKSLSKKEPKFDGAKYDFVPVNEEVWLENDIEEVCDGNVEIDDKDDVVQKTLSTSSSVASLSNSEGLFSPCFKKEMNDLELNFYKVNDTKICDDSEIEVPEEKWVCDECTFLNNMKNVNCDVCSNSCPHMKKWRCEGCTYINNVDAILCLVCSSINRNIAALQGPLVKNDFNDSSYSLRARGVMRKRRSRGINMNPRSWICEYCDESNDASLNSCQTCNTPKTIF